MVCRNLSEWGIGLQGESRFSHGLVKVVRASESAAAIAAAASMACRASAQVAAQLARPLRRQLEWLADAATGRVQWPAGPVCQPQCPTTALH